MNKNALKRGHAIRCRLHQRNCFYFLAKSYVIIMTSAHEYQLRCTDRTGQLHSAESLLELELVSGSHIIVSGLLLLSARTMNQKPISHIFALRLCL